MQKRKAFTLIELLVVIAIIALLMAIVTPALRKAKDYAKRVICGSNLKQVGIALKLYSENNDGEVIPMRESDGEEATDLYPWHVVLAYSPSYTDEDDPSKYLPLHLGVLYDCGYIDTPEVFYCPAQPRNSDFPLKYYYDYYTDKGAYEWGTYFPPADPEHGGSNVRVSYNYWTYGKKRSVDIGGVQPILVDNIQEWETIPHRRNASETSAPQGLSALFNDGHVAFCSGDRLFSDDTWNDTNCYNDDLFDGPGHRSDTFTEILRAMQGN